MPSTTETPTNPLEGWEGAVERLQSAVATGRPVMIPGTLERRPSRRSVIEPAIPHGPLSAPDGPDSPATREYEGGAAPPAISASPLDRIASMMLQLTEWCIRQLRTA